MAVNVYREITPLADHDLFVVLDSISNGFDYPIHCHPEYELNLVMGVSGVRLVGDSTERYNEYDLVLLGPYLYHKWTGEEFDNGILKNYRVITIQFSASLFEGPMFQKERFFRIRRMLEDSIRGIKFNKTVLVEAMKQMVMLTEENDFRNVIHFFELLDMLSRSDEKIYLASEGFTPATLKWDSNRIQTAYNYIIKNFSESKFKIGEVASIINMSESAFSHFFKKYTNKSFTEFLQDVRIGHACKLLLSTDETVNQIAYKSGFNNIANFNRMFKKCRNVTPVEYRNKHKMPITMPTDSNKEIKLWQFIPPNSKKLSTIDPVPNSTRVVHV